MPVEVEARQAAKASEADGPTTKSANGKSGNEAAVMAAVSAQAASEAEEVPAPKEEVLVRDAYKDDEEDQARAEKHQEEDAAEQQQQLAFVPPR